MASAMNGCGGGGGGGGGGVMKRMGLLRVQYYCVMGFVAAAVVLATLRYMPAPATAPPTVDGGGATVRSSAATVDSAAAAAAAAPGGGGVERGKGKRKHVWSGEEEEVAAEKKAAAGVVVFNFGDSNSDTGGVAAVMGIHIAAPEGRAYFHHPTGRLSDGRVILDFICEFLLLPILISNFKSDSKCRLIWILNAYAFCFLLVFELRWLGIYLSLISPFLLSVILTGLEVGTLFYCHR
jgi:hypothetical protein